MSVNVDKFWAKVEIRGEDECWIWKESVGPRGYGQVRVGPRIMRSHIVAAGLAGIHPSAEKPMILHSCPLGDQKLCCNPRHLRAGTALDNSRDAVERGRQTRGERVGSAQLTEADVFDARVRYSLGVTARALAVELGVHTSTVVNAIRGRTWAHVPGAIGRINKQREAA